MGVGWVLTQVLTTNLLSAGSDLMCQNFELKLKAKNSLKTKLQDFEDEEGSGEETTVALPEGEISAAAVKKATEIGGGLDYRRAANFAGSGVISAFIAVPWYTYGLPTLIPGHGPTAILAADIIDNTFTPGWSIPLGFYCLNYLKGKDTEEFYKKFRQDGLKTYITSASLGFPSQLIQFAVVPIEYQPLYMSATGFFISGARSYLLNKEVMATDKADKVEQPQQGQAGDGVQLPPQDGAPTLSDPHSPPEAEEEGAPSVDTEN